MQIENENIDSEDDSESRVSVDSDMDRSSNSDLEDENRPADFVLQTEQGPVMYKPIRIKEEIEIENGREERRLDIPPPPLQQQYARSEAASIFSSQLAFWSCLSLLFLLLLLTVVQPILNRSNSLQSKDAHPPSIFSSLPFAISTKLNFFQDLISPLQPNLIFRSSSSQGNSDPDFVPLPSNPHYYTSLYDDDTARDEWPSMVSTLRMCPPFHSYVTLAYGSRWLVHPKNQSQLYSYSFLQSNLTYIVKEIQVDTGSQREVRSIRFANSIPSYPSAPLEDVEDELLVTRRSKNQLRAITLYSPSAWRYQSIDLTTPLPIRNAALARLSAYDNHDQDAKNEPLGGPLLEINLLGPALGYYLIILQVEWMPADQPWRKHLLKNEKGQSEDGVAIMTKLLPIPNWEGERKKDIQVALELASSWSCSYRAELDHEKIKQRIRIEETARERLGDLADFSFSLNIPALDEMAKRINNFIGPSTFEYWHYNHIIYCPMPHGSLGRSYLLDQHPAGPILRLNAVSLISNNPDYGFDVLSIATCGLRTRRVTNSLIVSPMFGPPSVMSTTHLHSFLNYYLWLGIEKFYFVDRFASFKPALLPYIRRGLVEYTYKAYGQAVPSSAWEDQWLMLEYLQHTIKQEAEWMWQMDFDEYFVLEHPYFNQNPNIVRPPSPSCHNSTEAWIEALTVSNRSALIPFLGQLASLHLPLDLAYNRSSHHRLGKLSTPFPCDCMLQRYQALPQMDSLTYFRGNGVLLFGISEPKKSEWDLLRNETKKRINQQTTERPEDRRLRVWTELTHSADLPFYPHPIDLWTHRSPILDTHRSKWFARSLYITAINQHQVFTSRDYGYLTIIDSQFWSLDGGLFLPDVLANSTGEDNNTAWELAKNNPLIPNLKAAVTKTKLYPLKDTYNSPSPNEELMEKLPYAATLYHWAHYFCIFRPKVYDNCTPSNGMNGYRLQFGPSRDIYNLTGEEARVEEDTSMLLWRENVREWSDRMSWNRGIDNFIQWNKWKAEAKSRNNK